MRTALFAAFLSAVAAAPAPAAQMGAAGAAVASSAASLPAQMGAPVTDAAAVGAAAKLESLPRLPMQTDSHVLRLAAHLAHLSELVVSSPVYTGMPNYAQALLLVSLVVLVFVLLWGCTYCVCLAATERSAVSKMRKKQRHR